MRHLSLLIVCLLISLAVKAQEESALSYEAQRILVQTTLLEEDTARNIALIDSLLGTHRITYTYLQDSLIGLKLTHQKNLYSLPYRRNKDTGNINQDAAEILKTYRYAIDNQTDDNLKGMIECNQYKFLEELAYSNGKSMNDSLMSVYAVQRSTMIKKGYIPKRLGIGLGGQFATNEQKWIGFDISAFSYYVPSNMQNKHDPDHLCICLEHRAQAGMLNIMTFGYLRALRSPVNDFYVSLIEIRAPFVIIPTRFGFQYSEVHDELTEPFKPHFYYRPALGFGLGTVYISYSYIIPLSKSMNITSSRHMFNLGISYPVTNRYKVRNSK